MPGGDGIYRHSDTLIGVYEEIHTSEKLRQEYPDYTHRIFHIFRCSLAGDTRRTPTEQDVWQQDCIWMDISKLPALPLMPVCIREHIAQLIHTASPLYLGSHFIAIEENV